MKKLIILIAAACGLAGCNLGMAPSGGDTAQVEANFRAMPPQDRIKVIKGSPASPEKKAQLIKAIEDETGYHDPSSDSGPMGGGSRSRSVAGPATEKGGQ